MLQREEAGIFSGYVLISQSNTSMLPLVIRAVIFDLDGTLVHSLPGLSQSLNRVLAQKNLPVHNEKVVRTFIGNGIRKLVKRAAPDVSSTSAIDELTAAMSADYARNWQHGTTPYTGTSEALKTLVQQGIPLSVLSNKPHRFCRKITDLLFPDITFAKVVGQREGIPAKPDPTGALELARSLAISPETIAFVGDSTIDLATAKNAGMISVAASWGYHDLPALQAETPDYLIESIRELPAIASPTLT